MQAGFMCLESGLTRSKNSINVAVKNFADFGISVLLFWLIGYRWMFGGYSPELLSDPIAVTKLTAFLLFEMMFCSTATTIVSGAVAERIRFKTYLMVAALTSGLIYPIFGRWVWNGLASGELTGWLAQLGFVDFAGSTVVHSVGGWVGLAALVVIGPRIGRFSTSPSKSKIQASNLQLSVLGTILLWLGWLGFNGGSTLALNPKIADIIVNTVLAGASGMLTAGVISWQRHRVPEVEALINGSLAGLVAITASCHAVTPNLALVIGMIGAGVMMLVSYGLKQCGIDDAVDAVAVHTGAGIWGTLAVALFGQLDVLGTDLNRPSQFLVQLLGIVIAMTWSFGVTFIVLHMINSLIPLRVSKETERQGLNASEHHAKTELYELIEVMQQQAETQDLSLRVPENAWTEVGQVGLQYNQVMEVLEDTMSFTEAILQSVTDAIITFAKPSWEILSINPSAEKIFGYSKAELIGRSILQLFEWQTPYPKEQELLLSEWMKNQRQEVLGCPKNQGQLVLEVTITEGKFGEQLFYTGVFRDVSQQKQASDILKKEQDQLHNIRQLQEKNNKLKTALKELKQTQNQLIQAEKMSSLGQLVAGVAHEINNPVSFVYGNLIHAQNYAKDLLRILELYQQQFPEPGALIQSEVEIVDLDFIKEDFPKLVESMQVGADRIREIVRSLKTFSRHDEAELKTIDIHQSIESTLMILSNRIKANGKYLGIEIIRRYNNPLKIECYGGQLSQVFMNILCNGIDALHEAMEKRYFTQSENGNFLKKPKIWITTSLDQSQQNLQIKIADNGPGISSESAVKLFDPFFTTKPIGKGTGLGLSISYQIVVERHQGRIWCNSQPETGAEFVIEIPVKQTLKEQNLSAS
jgi:ammonium transporter